MDLAEIQATVDQFVRERQALDHSYRELEERVSADADEAKAIGVERPPEELLLLVAQLANFVNFEREHANKL